MAVDTETVGLSSAEVAERIAQGQHNDVPRRTSRSTAEIARSNVFTLFNAIVGTLCAIVLIFGQPQDALFGLVIVANTGIGILQELRAKRTLDRLALVGAEPVRVIRDGAPTDLQPHEIVNGDEILLAAGDPIVVDGQITASAGLEIDESLLTGEADPVPKTEGEQALSGSFVAAGSGRFEATKVGLDAYAAQLAAEASRFTLASSQLRAGIDRFLRMITWLIIPVAILLTISQLATADADFADAVSGSVAGIVTMIPEGLVLLTSIAFAVGVVRLGARNCLVQELPAIEVLARVDVLCLDKTGTLTEGGMQLDEVLELRPGLHVRRVLAELTALEDRPNATLKAIADGLASRDLPGGQNRPRADGVGGSTTGWRPVRVVPFSSTRKWSGAAFDGAGAWVMGAPDVLLGPADPSRAQAQQLAADGFRVLVAGQVNQGALDDPDSLPASASVVPAALIVLRQRLRTEAPDTLRYFAEQGVAIKVISGDNAASVGAVAAELGIAGADHPVDARTLPSGQHSGGSGRPGVFAAQYRNAPSSDKLYRIVYNEATETPQVAADRAETPGVAGARPETPQVTASHAETPQVAGGRAETPQATASHAETPQATASDTETAGVAGTVSEADLHEMARVLEANSVFGRVSPQQKRLFVAALQSAGHTVAMTGDGVNDVLALKDADLGVAMGSGSGATRAVAKVVLLDNNFASLPYVVAEGRRVLGNIERVAALFLTKTMYAIMLSVAVAVTGLADLAGLRGLQFPFLPRHLTLISTLTIGVPAFVLALAPNIERARPGFVSRVLRFAIPAGMACAAATFISYVLARLAPSASLVSDRTTATIALFAVAVWVLALVARPYTWWRLTLVAVMAACFLGVLAIPWTRHFFLLNAAGTEDVLFALAVAAVAATALTISQTATRRRPGQGARGR